VTRETIEWVTASPLWQAAAADVARMRRPALLGFASDSFMDDHAAVLGNDPRALATLVARPESHRARPPGESREWVPPASQLKLFQAVHGRFYLVAATLACRRTGLPDHAVATAAGEQTGFVVRRVAAGVEHAWTAAGWQAVATAGRLAPGEELLPMFPVNFTLSEQKRRLYVGLVPTSSVETFKAAGGVAPPTAEPQRPGEPPPDGRLDTLDMRVIQPLQSLRESKTGGEEEPSLFVLLDLGDFLQAHVPSLWASILAGRRPTGEADAALYDRLAGEYADALRHVTWRTALASAWGERLVVAGEQPGESTTDVNLRYSSLRPAPLRTLVEDVLPPADAAARARVDGEDPSTLDVPKLDPQGEALYTLRCVYRRPQCAPLDHDVVSDASEQFLIAPVFDVDAPAREIRIPLPINTSIKELRKFRKNVGFMISNGLREQMGRVGKLDDVMKGDLASGRQFDLGMVCSFSIPIITICALMLLMIFVALLNIVFWWLPFFRICFPIPLVRR
jgi:hypothetical protein